MQWICLCFALCSCGTCARWNSLFALSMPTKGLVCASIGAVWVITFLHQEVVILSSKYGIWKKSNQLQSLKLLQWSPGFDGVLITLHKSLIVHILSTLVCTCGMISPWCLFLLFFCFCFCGHFMIPSHSPHREAIRSCGIDYSCTLSCNQGHWSTSHASYYLQRSSGCRDWVFILQGVVHSSFFSTLLSLFCLCCILSFSECNTFDSLFFFFLHMFRFCSLHPYMV